MKRALASVMLCACGGTLLQSGDAGTDAATSATLLQAIDGPVDLALGGIGQKRVFVATSSGVVASIAKDGSGAKDIAVNQGSPVAIAANETNVYWATQGDMTLWGAPSDYGGAITAMWSFPAPPVRLAATNLVVVAAYASGIAADDAGVPKTLVDNATPADVATDGASVFWTDASSGNVSSKPLSGGVTTPLASSPSPDRLAIDAANVYWADATSKAISSVSKLGGAVTTIAALEDVFGVATDGTSVYWTEPKTGRVAKAPVTGGAISVVCTGLVEPRSVAVDDTSVYVVADKGLYRVAK